MTLLLTSKARLDASISVEAGTVEKGRDVQRMFLTIKFFKCKLEYSQEEYKTIC